MRKTVLSVSFYKPSDYKPEIDALNEIVAPLVRKWGALLGGVESNREVLVAMLENQIRFLEDQRRKRRGLRDVFTDYSTPTHTHLSTPPHTSSRLCYR